MNEQLYVRRIRLQAEQSLFKAQLRATARLLLDRMCVGSSSLRASAPPINT